MPKVTSYSTNENQVLLGEKDHFRNVEIYKVINILKC